MQWLFFAVVVLRSGCRAANLISVTLKRGSRTNDYYLYINDMRV
jgi:hypothetical protein